MATRVTYTDVIVNPGWGGRDDADAALQSKPDGRRGRFAPGRALARWRARTAARRGCGGTGILCGEERDQVDRGAAAIAVYHAFR